MLNDAYERRYSVFVSRLKQARIDFGLTQKEVAVRLGRSQSFVSRSELGDRRVDIIELEAFARIYEKELDYFLEDK